MTLALALTVAALPAIAAAANHAGHGGHHPPAKESAQNRIYTTTGTVEGLDAAAGKAAIRHEAIPALGWPAMSMRFAVENPALLQGLKAGDAVRFDFRNNNGVYVILDLEKL
ncbi:MAG: copper-binding protein [Deltaproteobacteria bacterium]|nr:copper-binding protein [Deltaproteobacteria bacterium]